MTRWLVLAVILGGACKKDDKFAKLDATATVVGSTVVVTAPCTNFESVAAAERGAFTKCANGQARLEIPIEKLGTGKQTINLRGSDSSGRTIALVDLEVDVELSGRPPYLRASCTDSDPADEFPTTIAVKIGEQNAVECQIFGGANAKVIFEGNPNSKLSIAGKTVTVPETGKLTQLIDFTEQVLALKLADVANDPEEPMASRAETMIAIPYSLESDGKTLAGTVELRENTAGHLGTHFLARVAAGKAERGGFTAPKAGERRTAGWVTAKGKLFVTDRSGTIREVDLVATDRETGRTENGTCEYTDMDGKAVTAKRILIDVELAVMNLADGTVEKKPFPSPRMCPAFEVTEVKDPKAEARVENEAIKAWLASLAAPQ